MLRHAQRYVTNIGKLVAGFICIFSFLDGILIIFFIFVLLVLCLCVLFSSHVKESKQYVRFYKEVSAVSLSADCSRWTPKTSQMKTNKIVKEHHLEGESTRIEPLVHDFWVLWVWVEKHSSAVLGCLVPHPYKVHIWIKGWSRLSLTSNLVVCSAVHCCHRC